jgi:signal transduction histidine kinase
MRISISHRIVIGFILVVVLSLLVGYFAFLSTKNVQRISRAILRENVSSLKAAEELELALLNQKGIVASYFLDNDASWLDTLEERKKDFSDWFKKASDVALTSAEKDILKDIKDLYKIYDIQRNKAIKLYQDGNYAAGRKVLLNDLKKSLDDLYQKCEDLILANEILISNAEGYSQKHANTMLALIWLIIIATLALGGFMGFLFSKRINEQLIRSAKMATLGEMAANIAHEIRNPLTSIKMRLYTLQDQIQHNHSANEDATIIGEEIERMENTVKNFLDFSRLPEPSLQRGDIHQTIDSIINFILPKAKSQEVEIKKDFRATSSELNIDKEQMRQVFLNIMLNAIEAMPKGGVLEIKTQDAYDGKIKDAVQIVIKDSGVGIAAENQKKLFEPFFTTKTEGTGLGLFISKKIVHMHKGIIDVASQEGQGATFTIALPLEKFKG